MTPIIRSIGRRKLAVPAALLAAGGFAQNQEVEIYPLPEAAVILKRQMTAMELVGALDSLQRLTAKLCASLAGVCGPCESCAGGEDCPALPAHTATKVPESVRQEAGIPEGAKLCAWPGPEKGTVTVSAANYRYDLTDVPDWLLEVLRGLGVCLGSLEERLMAEDIVYGG